MRLVAALNRTRAQRQSLPSPLPDEPPVPFEYLIRLYTSIAGPRQLSPSDQAALLAQLQVGLREDGHDEAARRDIVMLLGKLRDREDVTYRTRSEVDAVLSTLGVESATASAQGAGLAVFDQRPTQPQGPEMPTASAGPPPPGADAFTGQATPFTAAGEVNRPPPVSSSWQPDPGYVPPPLPPPGWDGAAAHPFPAPARSRRRGVIIAAVVLLIAAVGIGVGLYFGLHKNSSTDEDQIRGVIAQYVSAYNDGDEARMKSLECAKEAQYGIWVDDEDRAQRGTIDIQVHSVKVDGDHATAQVTGTSTRQGSNMHNELQLVREGGSWKACS